MVMNLTIDDTAGVLSYSSGWRVQPSKDTAFFQGTYHASESTSQTVSVTFNGTAIYIYGSKGTTYGGFSVQVDNVVTLHTSTLPSSSNPPVDYQQVIYADTFDSGTHLVELTTTSDKWVDIDYVILTSAGPDEGNPNPGSFSSTLSALDPSSSSVAASSSSTPASSSPSSSPSPSTSSSSGTSSTATALAGVFGGLLGLVLLGFLIFTLLKRQRRKQYEHERNFRRGPTRSYIGDEARLGLDATEQKAGGGGVFSGLLRGGGGGERSGTPQSGVSSSRGNATPSPGPESMMGVFNYAAVRPSQSSSGMSPYGQYGMAPATQGHGHGAQPGPYGQPGAYRQTVPEDMDPRHSIDFLSVRS